jgi:hypothetical protein
MYLGPARTDFHLIIIAPSCILFLSVGYNMQGGAITASTSWKVKFTGLTQTLVQLQQSLIGMLSQTAGSTEKLWVNSVNFRFGADAPLAGDAVARRGHAVLPRTGDRHVRPLGALRAHAKAPHRSDLLWRTLRVLNHPRLWVLNHPIYIPYIWARTMALITRSTPPIIGSSAPVRGTPDPEPRARRTSVSRDRSTD